MPACGDGAAGRKGDGAAGGEADGVAGLEGPASARAGTASDDPASATAAAATARITDWYLGVFTRLL
jgi:hypothetical protein